MARLGIEHRTSDLRQVPYRLRYAARPRFRTGNYETVSMTGIPEKLRWESMKKGEKK